MDNVQEPPDPNNIADSASKRIGEKLAQMGERMEPQVNKTALAAQLSDLAKILTEAIDHVIGSRQNEGLELENYQNALSKIRGVRIALEGEARQLLRSAL